MATARIMMDDPYNVSGILRSYRTCGNVPDPPRNLSKQEFYGMDLGPIAITTRVLC